MARKNENTNGNAAEITITTNGNVSEVQEATELQVTETETLQPEPTPTVNNGNGLTPHTNVDELQEIKTWIDSNNGKLLASMLRSLPQPVNKNISLKELCDLLGLAYEPCESVVSKVEKIKTPLRTWLVKFDFNYQNMVLALSQINTDENDVDNGLADLANTLTSVKNDQTAFRGLFGR